MIRNGDWLGIWIWTESKFQKIKKEFSGLSIGRLVLIATNHQQKKALYIWHMIWQVTKNLLLTHVHRNVSLLCKPVRSSEINLQCAAPFDYLNCETLTEPTAVKCSQWNKWCESVRFSNFHLLNVTFRTRLKFEPKFSQFLFFIYLPFEQHPRFIV